MTRPFRARLVPAVLFLAAAVGCFGYWGWREWNAPGPLAAPKIIVLPRGAGLFGIAEALGDDGVVTHPWLFAFGAALSGEGGRLKAGEYEFAAALSPRAAAEILASGKTVQHRLAIPEGLSSADIVALVNEIAGLEGVIDPIPGEGTMMPQTYFYSLGDRRMAVIERMQRAFNKTVAEIWAGRSPDLPFAVPEQAVILASIIEKETSRDDERGRIAGVYLNRLRLGMRLQADPTVVYALTKGKKPLDRALTRDDLNTESPYNTYLVKGLPPHPIANPGLASLRAAIHPATVDDLYFVADGTGGHVFAKTLAEHNQHVAQYHRGQAPHDNPVPGVH
jgi:UPF0755 protein